jgi:hypothetical protein
MCFTARRGEGPCRLVQNRSRTSQLTLKSDAAAERSKDQLSRDFRVVRFSTFATKSASKADLPVALSGLPSLTPSDRGLEPPTRRLMLPWHKKLEGHFEVSSANVRIRRPNLRKGILILGQSFCIGRRRRTRPGPGRYSGAITDPKRRAHGDRSRHRRHKERIFFAP